MQNTLTMVKSLDAATEAFGSAVEISRKAHSMNFAKKIAIA